MAGLTATGFESKTLDQIKAEMESALKAEFGLINTNPDSVFGQMIIALAPSIEDLWERLVEVFYSQYPASADGFALDNVCALTGIYRLAAVKSTVPGALRGTEGTVVPEEKQVSVNSTGDIFKTTVAREITIERTIDCQISVDLQSPAATTYSIDIDGVTYSSVQGAGAHTAADVIDDLVPLIDAIDGISATDLGDEMRIIADDFETSFLIGTLADLTVDYWYSPAPFQALVSGSLEVAIGTLTEIETPVSGWDSCTNFVAEVTGRDIETDSELRIRRTASLSIIGAATVPAIQARILQEVDDVTACLVVENDTMAEVGGRPAKSFECIISGGDDDEIAEKIWELKPAGIATHGGEEVTIKDIDGNDQTIKFSHPTPITIVVDLHYGLNTEETFPAGGEDAIKAAIKAMGDLQQIGEDIIIQKYFTPIYSIEGVGDVTSLTFDPDGDGPTSDNIVIAANEVATFALGDMTVATP